MSLKSRIIPCLDVKDGSPRRPQRSEDAQTIYCDRPQRSEDAQDQKKAAIPC